MLNNFQLAKKVYQIDEIIIILLVNLLFFFFIIPFVIYGIFGGIPYWTSLGDMIFLRTFFGFYDPRFHALILLFSAFAGSLLGLLLIIIWRKYKVNKSNNRKVDIESFITTKFTITFVLISGLLVIINQVAYSIRWWPEEIINYFVLGFWLGSLVGLHKKLTKIYKSLLIIKPIEKRFKISMILGAISTLSFISLGVFLIITKEKLFFIQTPVLSTVIGVNIILGLFIAISVLLIRFNHIYSGSILLIIFSYLGIGVGGGFIIGFMSGVFSGVFGLLSLDHKEGISLAS